MNLTLFFLQSRDCRRPQKIIIKMGKLIKRLICSIFGHKYANFAEFKRIGVNEYVHGARCTRCGKEKYVRVEKLNN